MNGNRMKEIDCWILPQSLLQCAVLMSLTGNNAITGSCDNTHNNLPCSTKSCFLINSMSAFIFYWGIDFILQHRVTTESKFCRQKMFFQKHNTKKQQALNVQYEPTNGDVQITVYPLANVSHCWSKLNALNTSINKADNTCPVIAHL